jgi:hypothetical protein
MTGINNEITDNKKYPKLAAINNCFNPISVDNFSHYFQHNGGKDIENVMFVNFNYTNLLTKYLAQSSKKRIKTELIHIHGELRDEKDIVFGYGDDTHPKYKELELLNDNEVLDKMKSFKYPTNSNYNKLMGFIEKRVFDVVVMGHSLGISDRVLLKTIFEHEHCKMITLLHRKTKKNDYKKWIPLSRHFDDKVEMRKKIKPFEDQDIL